LGHGVELKPVTVYSKQMKITLNTLNTNAVL